METQLLPRKPYPTDVSDDEWAFVAPYLSLMTPDAPQRVYDLREVYNALRWIVHTGAPWRYLPGDLPPWQAVYQTDPALARCRLLRRHGARPAGHAALGGGPQRSAISRHFR